MPPRKKTFSPTQSAEAEFSRQLRKVGKVIGHIVDVHTHNGAIDDIALQKALADYSKTIEPWAKRQSAKMLAKVSRTNRTAYQQAANKKLSMQNSKKMGALIKSQIAEGDVGRIVSRLMDEQVDLIKSLPLRAGLRAQQLAREAVYKGGRAESITDIIQELDRSGEVSESDATRIARTEIARSNALITETRAKAVGSHWYIWRTTMDGAERHSHAEMNGEHIPYDQPPTLSDGTKGHAGTFINCRCWQDVQFNDDEFEGEFEGEES